MISPAEARELVAASRFAGSDVLLAQGGGGNTSVKSADGARMWIKASGLRLAEIDLAHGFLETDLPALIALVRDADLAALPRPQAHEASVAKVQSAVLDDTTLRPSLETTMHAVLGPVVLHTHPVYVNAFTCMLGGQAALTEVCGEAVPWVPYAPPGFALGLAVDEASSRFQQANGCRPSALLLGNHGLIASGQTAAETVATTRKFVSAGIGYFGPLPEDACATAAPPAALVHWAEGLDEALNRRTGGRKATVRGAGRAALLEAAVEPERWLTAGPLVPDDVVYTGPKVWLADAGMSPETWLEREVEFVPERMIVAVAGLGVVLVAPNDRTLAAMEENLLAHVLTRRLIAARGRQARPLPAAEIDYLLSMESEHYRQAIAART